MDRKETDETEYGGKIAYELYDWEISYEMELVDVDKDKIGSRLADLKRDGVVHQFGAAYEIELDRGFELVPAIDVTIADMDGKSNKYQGLNGSLALMKKWRDVGLQVWVEAGRNGYDTRHPIFNKSREDTTCETMTVLSWFNPLGFEKFTLSIGAGYEETDSNIDFYDSSENSTFMMLGYRFSRAAQNDTN